MSVYGVHKLLKRIQRDAAFRDQLQRAPDAALADYPLTDQERTALLAGEVGELNALGVHGYLLNTLARYSVFGITREQYMERIRQPTRAAD
jgi:aromatic-ring opening dioxygenase LigAB LigA subunit